MATITDPNVALAVLQSYLQWDQAPALTAQEVSDLLDRHQTHDLWSDGEFRTPGDLTIPNTANGRAYASVAHLDGAAVGRYETGATEPEWPIVVGDTVWDGTVLWECVGAAPAYLWDLRAAAYEGWGMKASRVASETGSVKAGNLSVASGTVNPADACLAQQRRFRARGVN